MKMARMGTLVLFLFILSGCSQSDPEITEAEAETIVEQRHANSLGSVEIISMSYERCQYVDEWKNDENCE